MVTPGCILRTLRSAWKTPRCHGSHLQLARIPSSCPITNQCLSSSIAHEQRMSLQTATPGNDIVPCVVPISFRSLQKFLVLNLAVVHRESSKSL